jgi:predicted TIM-barrel fold metal-dependent hydrolase
VTDLPSCEPPDMNLRAPRFKMPAGATDTHFHLFGPVERYPLADLREYNPPLITPAMTQQVFAKLGIQRAVVIQPSVYGSDNRAQLEGAAEMGIPVRAVVVLAHNTTDAELAELHAQGARGLRYVLAHPGGLPVSDFEWWADRVKELGWHIQFLAKGPQLLELADRIEKLSCPAVIDHIGMFNPAEGLQQPAFKTVLRLISHAHWVKLSGAYRLTQQAAPFPALKPFIERLLETRPDRLVWASDWPHVFVKTSIPNTTDLLNALGDWLSDEALRNGILVDNPAALYGF